MKSFHILAFLLTLSVLFAGCTCETPLADRIAKADKAVFIGEMPGKVGDQIAFTDSGSLSTLKSLATWEKSPVMKCGQDGRLLYFTGKDTLLDVSITLQEGCFTASYLDGDSLKSVWLPAPAGELLGNARKTSLHLSDIDKLGWMLGKWTQTEPSGAVSFEEWRKATDNSFKGHSYTLMGKDTVFQEGLQVFLGGKDIYYEATVEENSGPVRFRMAESTPNSATFENKAHDFPQIIHYEAKGDSGLFARISGTVKGQYQKMEFPLKRVVE